MCTPGCSVILFCRYSLTLKPRNINYTKAWKCLGGHLFEEHGGTTAMDTLDTLLDIPEVQLLSSLAGQPAAGRGHCFQAALRAEQ